MTRCDVPYKNYVPHASFHLSRRSVGDDLESFELDHLRSIKLGANEKSEVKKKNEIIDLQTIFNFKKLY